MWILPNNLPSFPFAPESVASIEELNALLAHSEPWLLWKSKPRSLRIWWWAWKRVSWLRHLFGRILKPSLGEHFTEKYSSSLVDIPASLSAAPASGKAKTILDTYGRILNAGSSQLDLFASSLKTSSGTSASDSTRSSTAFGQWVTQLRQEYLQRQKLARHTREQEFLSLESWQTPKTTSGDYTNDNGNTEQRRLTLQGQAKWTTPVASDTDRNTPYQQGGTALSLQVKQWPTPRASANENRTTKPTPSQEEGKHGKYLASEVQRWPTASARDWKSPESNQHGKNARPLNEVVLLWYTPTFAGHNSGTLQEWGGHRNPARGQQDQDNPNTPGNVRGLLNPGWVCQLMGTTLEKIFFVPLVTE